MLRAIREIQPSYVVGENVRGLTNWNGGVVFDEVQADLETQGYEVLPFLLPACAVNAPHRRDRLWFIAFNTNFATGKPSEHLEGQNGGGFSESEQEEIFRGTYDQSIVFGSIPSENGVIANTDGVRGTQEHELQQAKLSKQLCEAGIIANTNGTGREKFNVAAESNKQNINSRNVMHANRTISEGKHFRQTREREFNGSDSRIRINGWENFPTQSPICYGDDGFSGRLDSITFSKWRNESIKAGGNAIVPQVAHRIFKAIKETTL
jgi:DNA (cytosine-5)-methyltransferase 1